MTYTFNDNGVMKLAIGRPMGSTRVRLYAIGATMTRYGWPWMWEDPATSMGVDPATVSIGDMGMEGSDGLLYVLLPDNDPHDATPRIAGVPFYTGYISTLGRYTLTLMASTNGTPVDLSTNTPEFCVGQQVMFWLNGLPDSVTNIAGNWQLPDKFVNHQWQHTDLGIPYGSVNYDINNSLLQNTNQTSCWFYDGTGGKVKVGLNLLFNNGQAVNVAAFGNISVYRPTFSGFHADGNYFSDFPTWIDALPYLQGNMDWEVTLNSK